MSYIVRSRNIWMYAQTHGCILLKSSLEHKTTSTDDKHLMIFYLKSEALSSHLDFNHVLYSDTRISIKVKTRDKNSMLSFNSWHLSYNVEHSLSEPQWSCTQRIHVFSIIVDTICINVSKRETILCLVARTTLFIAYYLLIILDAPRPHMRNLILLNPETTRSY